MRHGTSDVSCSAVMFRSGWFVGTGTDTEFGPRGHRHLKHSERRQGLSVVHCEARGID